MGSTFLPKITKTLWTHLVDTQDQDGLFDLVTQPLHEELYRRQDFKFMDELSPAQQMLLAYDYIQSQVLQGGFLQLIQNKYISLLLPAIEGLEHTTRDQEMIPVLDDVLKVYVLNQEALDRETSVDEFAALYQEFKEFEILDEKFSTLHSETMKKITGYISAHPEQFAILV